MIEMALGVAGGIILAVLFFVSLPLFLRLVPALFAIATLVLIIWGLAVFVSPISAVAVVISVVAVAVAECRIMWWPRRASTRDIPSADGPLDRVDYGIGAHGPTRHDWGHDCGDPGSRSYH
jgi:hypothetical protein